MLADEVVQQWGVGHRSLSFIQKNKNKKKSPWLSKHMLYS